MRIVTETIPESVSKGECYSNENGAQRRNFRLRKGPAGCHIECDMKFSLDQDAGAVD